MNWEMAEEIKRRRREEGGEKRWERRLARHRI
jgi:hypothetical protein